MKRFLYIIPALVILVGCEPKIDEFSPSSGNADFTKTVAVGNSLMAGFTNSALYKTGQEASIPKLITDQFSLAGGGTFVQPMVNSEFGVEYPGAPYRLKMGYAPDCHGQMTLGPVPDIGPREPIAPVGYPVNNLGIPGAKSFHLLFPGYAQLNPYYARFASSPDIAVIQEIQPLNPSFFICWLGSNDVLGYATSGGVGDSITGQQIFGEAMGGVLTALTANGAKGAIANITDIHSIPFFTTIPYNGLVLDSDSLVNMVNYAMGLFGLPFTYQLGPNPFLVPDPTSPHPMFKVRQMQPGELVLLTVPQDSMKCYGMGLISALTFKPWPIPDQYVLTLDEIANIEAAITGYNQTITALAQNFGLALVDMNAKLKELQTGITWDAINMNAAFVTGGAFSLDGIHLTARGNAVAANYFLQAINMQYGSNLPMVDITKYPGVEFP